MTLNLKLNHKPDNSVAVAEMIDRHVRCDVSGLVDVHTLGAFSAQLDHTDITIREMRACVADADILVEQDTDIDGEKLWGWYSLTDGSNTYTSELDALKDACDFNNLDPARYAREPLQWLAVSDDLAVWLREHGETVRNFPAGLTPEASAKEVLNIWLRCTAGELADDIALRSVWETAG